MKLRLEDSSRRPGSQLERFLCSLYRQVKSSKKIEYRHCHKHVVRIDAIGNGGPLGLSQEDCMVQFGFQKGSSTDKCYYFLRQILQKFTSGGSRVYACFLDASRAFDSINFNVLFAKMLDRGTNPAVVRLVAFWYKYQRCHVKWKGGFHPDSISICKGVRQGGFLSPILFSLYIDDMISAINSSPTACKVGDKSYGVLCYADDIVLLSPTSKGLQGLVDCAYAHARNLQLTFNPLKSVALVFGKRCAGVANPAILLGNEYVVFSDRTVYLGFTVVDTLKDDADMQLKLQRFIIASNCILRKVSQFPPLYRVSLLRTYTFSFYGISNWGNYTKASLRCFTKAYNNMIRKAVGIYTSRTHISPLLFAIGLLPFEFLIRQRRKYFSCRVLDLSTEEAGTIGVVDDLQSLASSNPDIDAVARLSSTQVRLAIHLQPLLTNGHLKEVTRLLTAF